VTAPLAGLTGLIALEDAVAALLSADAVVSAPEAVRPFAIAALASVVDAGILLVATPTSADAERVVHDLVQYVEPDRVERFPAWETLPFERVSPAAETMGERLRVLGRIDSVQRGAVERPLIVVAPIKALLQRLATGDEHPVALSVALGDRLDPDTAVERLVAMGYRPEYQVEHRGELARRGGIVDVFPATGESGIRIDCFGDEIERLTRFDVADQRSTEDLEAVEIVACRELVTTGAVRTRAAQLAPTASFGRAEFGRIADGELFDGMESFLPWLVPAERLLPDLLGDGDRVVILDPRRTRDRAAQLLDEEAGIVEALAATWGLSAEPGAEDTLPRLHLPYERLLANSGARVATIVGPAEQLAGPVIAATGWPAAVGDASAIARRAGELARRGLSVVVAADGDGSAVRLRDILESEGLTVTVPTERGSLRRAGVHLVVAPLDKGFILESAQLAVLAEPDLTGRRRPHRIPRARAKRVEGFFDDLEPGSYVVHQVHGVGRYKGMVTRAIGGSERDYLLLEYRGDDKLYIPSDQIDSLTPYSGGESPSLHRLGGSEWTRQRGRVRAAVREIAQELVVLYQRRLATPGHPFASDTPWQAEVEAAFPYPETHDQLAAIEQVKADMESPSPMDRLVCGDVGFGKTEVAVRAIFKAVQDGKQAAVLVPTTLLAQQHHQTIADRFAPYPIRVEVLSRFLTPGEAKAVVAGLRSGTVDVVVGTHRLLGEDVAFHDLGLLVVDEEQRFGVDHKEATKKLKVGVDVLTLTASPIPRTLEMGLTGIRDLSVIDTPPAARQPILTYVGESDERAVAEAIRRELLREGQVFFVHNRVQDIERIAGDLRALVPEAEVAVAHGQMDEGSLERVVLDFADGKFDVLVCTTIIESGIDMPTVNTLVVDRADLLGLGQLHQLRGRVGRGGQRAYAYLFHPADRVLSEQAYERLRTIGEHTELGSGFKIAMRDLEIRGAGNLLGNDQSGHIAAVGYDLYVKMVAEAVAELKGEEFTPPEEVKLELPVDAHIPATYIGRDDLRLEAYRRLADVREDSQVDDIAAEWTDRYGVPPRPVQALLGVARLRAVALRVGLRELSVVKAVPGSGGPARMGESVARLSPLRLRASEEIRLRRLVPRAIYKADAGQLIVPMRSGDTVATDLATLLDTLIPTDDRRSA
jgi:transcription-repair coupling factor (superfamily II helicase)